MNAIRFTAVIAAVAVLALAGTSRAAVVTGDATVLPSDVAPFNLTEIGTDDWAYWSTGANPATGVPTNQLDVGTIVGNVTPINGTGVRGSTSPNQPRADYTFTNGLSPAAGSVTNATGLFNQTLHGTNVGVRLTLTLPEARAYTVSFWGGAFEGTARLEATLPGAVSFIDSTLTHNSASPKGVALYEMLVLPDTPGDVLTLNYTLINDATPTSGSSHVLISGVAISRTVPTPAALPAGLALMGLALTRRRRRA